MPDSGVSAVLLFISKALPIIVLPEGLVLIGMLVAGTAALARWRRSAFVAGSASVALFWLAATPAIGNWALGTLERQHPPLPLEATAKADVAILLGGAVGPQVAPRRSIELGESTDRVLHAVRLLRAGKVDRVLVVGGNLPWDASTEAEAVSIRNLMVEWGANPAAIEIEGASRNTYENALEAVAARARRPFARALLVTSAAHMPRALAIFRKAGIPVTPYVCDVRVTDALTGTALDWLPNARYFAMTSDAAREWIGYWAYRWRGWL